MTMKRYNGPQAMDDAERKAHIEATNLRVSRQNMAMRMKARHERRHGAGHRTTLAEHKKWMSEASKD